MIVGCWFKQFYQMYGGNWALGVAPNLGEAQKVWTSLQLVIETNSGFHLNKSLVQLVSEAMKGAGGFPKSISSWRVVSDSESISYRLVIIKIS